MYQKVKRNLVLINCLALLIACSNQNWEVKKVKAAKLEHIPAEKTKKNDSLINALGEKLELSIHQSDAVFFIKKFSKERFNQLATYTEYLDGQIKASKQTFIESFSDGVQSLPEKIIETTDTGGFYNFINYYYDADTKTYRMLFRLFSEVEGINYHDFELVPLNGEFYIQDVYIYLTGENLSDTANKLFLMAMPKNIFERIITRGHADDMKHLLSAIKSQKDANYQKAVNYLNKIKGTLKHSKIFHVMKVLAATNLDEDIYMKAMGDMQKDFKHDPTCHLLSIDYYFIKKDYNKAIQAINQLEIDTGDGFLNYQRGNIAFASKNYPEAIDYFEKLIGEFPSYDTPKFSLISCYTKMANYDNCVAILNQIMADDTYKAPDLIQFVESKEDNGTNSLHSLKESEAFTTWRKAQLTR